MEQWLDTSTHVGAESRLCVTYLHHVWIAGTGALQWWNRKNPEIPLKSSHYMGILGVLQNEKP